MLPLRQNYAHVGIGQSGGVGGGGGAAGVGHVQPSAFCLILACVYVAIARSEGLALLASSLEICAVLAMLEEERKSCDCRGAER